MSRVRISFPAPNIRTIFFFYFADGAGKWRYSQAVRPRSAKPLCPGSNPGGASKRNSVRSGTEFLSKNKYKCRCGGIGRRKGLKIFGVDKNSHLASKLITFHKKLNIHMPLWRNRQTQWT